MDKVKIGRQAVEEMIGQKSNDELEKFRKTVRFEYIFTLLLFPLTAMGGRWIVPDEVSYFALNLFLGGCLFFYRRVIHKSHQIHVEDDLRTYLQNALSFIKSYVRQYLLVCWLGGVVGLYIGAIGGHDAGIELGKSLAESENLMLEWLANQEGVINLSLIFLVISGIVGIHLYVKYLYQVRIIKLQQLLEELDEA